MTNRRQFKLVLLGEGCVGKTSIILRYVENQFTERYTVTNPSQCQAAFKTKRLNIEGNSVNIAIWDTAGQEQYHSLAPIYYRDSHGAIIVYDITDQDSFNKACNWVKELRKVVGDVPLCVVGNKSDLEKYRNVNQEEAEQYAASVNAKHYHTSAKLSKGLDVVFLDIARKMLRAQALDNPETRRPQPQRDASRRSIVVTDDVPDQQPSGGCCG